MLRIGEFSRRVGVAPDRLRVWERRYGLLSPTRTPAGQRLYGLDDEQRVAVMLDHLAHGMSAAEAASATLAAVPVGAPAPAGGTVNPLAAQLREAMDRFDDREAHRVLDRLLAGFTVETVLSEVVLPYLHELGDRWACAEVTVAQEHFASHLLLGRLHGLLRSSSDGGQRTALLACPSGEQHTLGLLCFAVAMRAHGWRVAYLGAETPTPALVDAAARVRPHLVVLSAVRPEPLLAAAPDLAPLRGRTALAIGGAGASARLAEHVGGRWLEGDPLEAAEAVTRETLGGMPARA